MVLREYEFKDYIPKAVKKVYKNKDAADLNLTEQNRNQDYQSYRTKRKI